MKEPHSGAAGLVELALIISRVNLGDDAIRFGMNRRIARHGESSTPHTLSRGVQTLRVLRMPEAGVVFVEHGVCVDAHLRWVTSHQSPVTSHKYRGTTALSLSKRILQISVAIALTVFFLWLFLRNANLGDVWSILKTTNVFWLTVAVAVNMSALVFRTIRWRTLLDPDDPPEFYATFFANTVGYMLSTVLPIRAADVARPALLARRTTHRFSGALGTVLMERVLDLYAILLLFVYFAIRRWNEFSLDPRTARWFFIVKTGAVAAAVLLTALSLFIVGLYFFRDTIRRLHEKIGRIIPQRFRDSWMHFFDTFVETLAIARHHAAFTKVLFCTAGIWFALTSQFYFAALALHRPLPFDFSIFLTGIGTLSLAIPTPGGVGGFHKAAQLVLTHFYFFDIDSSVAAAVLFHLVGTIPVVVTGLVLFAIQGLRRRDATRTP